MTAQNWVSSMRCWNDQAHTFVPTFTTTLRKRPNIRSAMKETPSRYDAVQLGDTLRLLDAQYAGITTVVEIIRKKKELDAHYADDLENLVHSFQDVSKEESIKDLLQPFLTVFAEEIGLRRASSQVMVAELEGVVLSEPPSESDAHPVRADGLIRNLFESAEDHDTCFDTVKRSIPKLQTWFEQLNVKIIADDITAELSDFKMPTEEINYRRSVSRQRKAAARLEDWYHQSMPVILEKHQARLEQVHRLAKRTSKEYITLATNLATSNSALLETVKAFSPLQTTALGHVMGEMESLSSEIHPAVYHNYVIDGTVSSFFLGSNLLTISLLDNDMEGLKLLRSSKDELYSPEKGARLLQTCFKIEGMGFEAFDCWKALSIYGRDTILALTYLEFANIDPLFPISEHITRQFSKGLSRKFMPQIMREAAESMKRSPVPINMKLVRHLFLEYDMSDVCEILTGNHAAKKILLDIARKWDFDKDAPLPEGVLRAVQETVPLIKLF